MDAKWIRKGDTVLITGQYTQNGNAGNGVYTVMGYGAEEIKKNVTEKFEYKVGDKLKHKFGAEYEVVAIEPANSKAPRGFKLKNLSNGCLDSPKWTSREQVYGHYEPASGMAKLLYGKR